MAKEFKTNPVIIRPDTSIGNIAAEADDDFLFDCFVDHPALDVARTLSNSKTFIAARTGGGKTALIRKIEKQFATTSSLIDLPGLSMNYVSNSDIVRFLKSIDIDLDLFFQALWKHVLCLEYIRLRYDIKNQDGSQRFFGWLGELFGFDQRRQSALKYLSEWQGRFFITMDENIKELTSKLEKNINLEMGAEVEKFSTRAGYTRTLSSEKRSELVARAKKIVSYQQLADLNRVIELLSEIRDENPYNKYFILIDKLDEKWVDENIRFDLIRALIECLRSFNKISDLKVLVSLREDVLERVIQETKYLGFQREKYDDYFLRLRWSEDQIKELVRKRISLLYKRKYTSQNVTFHDIFRSRISGKDAFDYLLERTLYRPRDMISFINECFEKAQGRTEVTPTMIKEAEARYSSIRLQALIQEWQSALPSLAIVFKYLAKRKARFLASELSQSDFMVDFSLALVEKDYPAIDPIRDAIHEYVMDSNELTAANAIKIILSELYRIGAVGLKLQASERYVYGYRDNPVISTDAVDLTTKVHIHPMLHRALNVQEMAR